MITINAENTTNIAVYMNKASFQLIDRIVGMEGVTFSVPNVNVGTIRLLIWKPAHVPNPTPVSMVIRCSEIIMKRICWFVIPIERINATALRALLARDIM
tara:strand:+ start:273 stop:572 length:300 start_codon:yes stop_codon:yes gene_type:complete